MAFMAFGFAEILVMVLLAGGQVDLVSLTPTKSYFTHRKLEHTPEKLMELASKEPTDSTVHFRQLLALKALAEDVDGFKKSAKFADYRKTIEDIAAGKSGQDPAGFSKVYAERLLLALDGKTEAPAPSTWRHEEELKTLPESVVQVYLWHIRPAGPRAIDAMLQKIEKRMGDEEREFFCNVVEKLGNIQFDGVTVGIAPVKDMEGDGEVYVRARGKFHQAWVPRGLANLAGAEIQEVKGPGNEKMLFLKFARSGGDEPNEVVLVDNRFAFIANYVRPRKDAKLMEPLLDTHFGKKPNVTTGPLKELLRKIPAKSELVVVGQHGNCGNWPSELKEVLAHSVDTPQGKDTEATITLENDKLAADALEGLNTMRQTGLMWLKGLQNIAPPDFALGDIQAALETLQAQKQGNVVTVRFLLSGRCIRSLPQLLILGRDQ